MAARLSFDERCVISAMVGVGALARQIADELGRHSSTVRREINRAGGRGGETPPVVARLSQNCWLSNTSENHPVEVFDYGSEAFF